MGRPREEGRVSVVSGEAEGGGEGVVSGKAEGGGEVSGKAVSGEAEGGGEGECCEWEGRGRRGG